LGERHQVTRSHKSHQQTFPEGIALKYLLAFKKRILKESTLTDVKLTQGIVTREENFWSCFFSAKKRKVIQYGDNAVLLCKVEDKQKVKTTGKET